MQRMFLILASLALWVPYASGQQEIAGKWHAQAALSQQGPDEFTLDLKVEGTKLLGTVAMNGGSALPFQDGAVNGNTITFKLINRKAPTGLLFTGKFNAGQITFSVGTDARPFVAKRLK